MKQAHKRLLISGIALVVIAAMATLYFVLKPDATSGLKTITISVTDSEYSANHSVLTDAEYLSEVLLDEEIAVGTEGPYGFFITSVDGIVADGSDGRYWVFTKSGEMVNTGAEYTPVSDGDSFEFYVYAS